MKKIVKLTLTLVWLPLSYLEVWLVILWLCLPYLDSNSLSVHVSLIYIRYSTDASLSLQPIPPSPHCNPNSFLTSSYFHCGILWCPCYQDSSPFISCIPSSPHPPPLIFLLLSLSAVCSLHCPLGFRVSFPRVVQLRSKASMHIALTPINRYTLTVL